jgi:hypothetical protein
MTEIKFGGEKRPVKYGWAAIAEFGKLTGVNFGNLGTIEAELDLAGILALIFVGLKHGARAEKKEFSLTMDEIGDFMDEEDDFNAKLQEFLDVFTQQMPQPKKAIAPQPGH